MGAVSQEDPRVARQQEDVKTVDPFHDRGPLYAELLASYMGDQRAWRYDGQRRYKNDPAEPVPLFELVCDDTWIRVEVFGSGSRYDRVSAHTLVPRIPDGSEFGSRSAGLEDYDVYFRGQRVRTSFASAISLHRFYNNPGTVAKHWIKYVIEPYESVLPQIRARRLELLNGYLYRDTVAADLAKAFNGTVRHEGDSKLVSFGGLYRGQYVPSPLPTMRVGYGGHIYFTQTPTLSPAACGALFGTWLAEYEARKESV